LAPAVFQTTRVETETEIAKWPGKPRDLDEYQVIPEVRTYVFFSQMFFLSFWATFVFLTRTTTVLSCYI